MQKSIDIEFEKAVRMLAEHMSVSEIGSRKPVLFHDIRVGVYLYEKNYPREVVLAGLLHDALEFSDITEDLIEKEFGENVLKIVKACTKDRAIENSDERTLELVKRCAEVGKDALIVKAVDTLDSFKYYTKENNQSELDYCRKNAEAILKYKKDFDNLVFSELGEWLENKF
jgi:guanosine-3',5'-bis(diphosphate) 3'-pyrophosphohydrolase